MRPGDDAVPADGDFAAAAADIQNDGLLAGFNAGRRSAEAECRLFLDVNAATVPAKAGPYFR